MAETEQYTKEIEQLLEKIGREAKLSSVLGSPQTKFDGKNLVSLDLSDLGLAEVPSDLLDGHKKLKALHLSFNLITELPEDIFKGTALTLINLYSNQIMTLPDGIFSGLKLDWLDLRSNELDSLPSSLAECDKLTYLYLQNNPLTSYEETDYDWRQDYHSKRDVGKFMPEFKAHLGIE